MVSCGVPLNVYLVFAKLLRAGYIVTRHPARWALGPADDLAAVAAAAHAWGTLPAGATAASPAEQQQQDEAAPAAQQKKQPPAVPVGPPRKKRRVEGQQQRSGRWWVGEPAAGAQEASAAAAAEAGSDGMEPQQAAGSSGMAPPGDRPDGHGKGAAGNPWLAGMPPQFLELLPRCEVLPTPSQRAAADFPRMGPLQSIPLGELRLPGGAAAGRSLLVSGHAQHASGLWTGCVCGRDWVGVGSGVGVRRWVCSAVQLLALALLATVVLVSAPSPLNSLPAPPCPPRPAAALRRVCLKLTLQPQAARAAGVHGGGAALLAAPHAGPHGSRRCCSRRRACALLYHRKGEVCEWRG